MSLFSIFYARNTCSLSLQSFLYILAIPPVILFGPLIYWIVSVANQVFRLRYPASSLTHAFTEMVSSPPGFPWFHLPLPRISMAYYSLFLASQMNLLQCFPSLYGSPLRYHPLPSSLTWLFVVSLNILAIVTWVLYLGFNYAVLASCVSSVNVLRFKTLMLLLYLV